MGQTCGVEISTLRKCYGGYERRVWYIIGQKLAEVCMLLVETGCSACSALARTGQLVVFPDDVARAIHGLVTILMPIRVPSGLLANLPTVD
jgi:hypothetical protein